VIYLADPDLTIHHGDALTVLQQLPAGCVHMCVTSPPFYGLRDYGVDQQIGLEASPQEWVDSLIAVFREVRRVLRPDGTLWLEVGDSYAGGQPGNGGSGAASAKQVTNRGSFHDGNVTRIDWRGAKPKDLVGAPWLLAFALRADGWYLRSDIIWARPNPMPESVTDRPTKSHSYLFLLAKSARYFYDADAIREEAEYGRRDWNGGVNFKGGDLTRGHGQTSVTGGDPSTGRNKRSVWTIPTEPLPDEHYAAYPQALVEPCVLAGTSERGVCPDCGAPWVRDVDVESRPNVSDNHGKHDGTLYRTVSGGVWNDTRRRTDNGWRPSCAHELEPVPATVLDPFLGSGTTALVARRLGRKCVGIELNQRYCAIAARRTQQLSLMA